MLKQILQEMYVAPELLAELSDDQKQLLFCKMREEQVRRYEEREKNSTDSNVVSKRTSSKQALNKERRIDFLLGSDGHEWVWVMGEHPDDLSIEEILEKEAQEKAFLLARQEVQKQRTEEEKELENLRSREAQLRKQQEMKEKELKANEEKARLLKEAELSKLQRKIELERKQVEDEKLKLLQIKNEQDTLTRRSLDRKKQNVNKRSSELLTTFQKARQVFIELAEKDKTQIEKHHHERERFARAEEVRRREVARSAREVHRRESLLGNRAIIRGRRTDPNKRSKIQRRKSPSDSPEVDNFPDYESIPSKAEKTGVVSSHTEVTWPAQPPDRLAVVTWFVDTQASEGVGRHVDTGDVQTWFHGIISRAAAEELLEGLKAGSFLVRVSERIWGYALSLRTEHRTKHYLIDSLPPGLTCRFFGSQQMQFASLNDLIEHHKNNPVSAIGQDLLLYPVGQKTASDPDYRELFPVETTHL